MKNIFKVLAFVFFSLNLSAQESTNTSQEKQEKSCSKHDAHSKQMTEDEIIACKAKCKAEGKICKAKDMSKCKKEDKKCSAKKE